MTSVPKAVVRAGATAPPRTKRKERTNSPLVERKDGGDGASAALRVNSGKGGRRERCGGGGAAESGKGGKGSSKDDGRF